MDADIWRGAGHQSSLISQLPITKAENQNAILISCVSLGVRHMSLCGDKTHSSDCFED